MEITSPAFNNNEVIPLKYTCDNDDISPALVFVDVPDDAESLVVICDDPDAPSGTWVHWTLWNIDPETTGIEEDTVPEEATEGVTSFGTPGYGGPCPPSGVHRYFFKLYALDTTLDDSIDENVGIEDLLNIIDDHILDEAELIGLYSRKK